MSRFNKFTTEGVARRPDMIIHLPKKGIIPVDAKVPMSAYLDACKASDPKEKVRLLEEHRRSLSNHIKDLSNKAYWDQFENAPQLVVLFLPYESGLEASFVNDPDLIDRAMDHKVIVAGPFTLYAFLKVISYGWMQIELSKNAEDIAKTSKDLIGRVQVFYSHFSSLGKHLNVAVGSFNKASSSLEKRVLPQLRKIGGLRGEQDVLPGKDEDGLFIEAQARE